MWSTYCSLPNFFENTISCSPGTSLTYSLSVCFPSFAFADKAGSYLPGAILDNIFDVLNGLFEVLKTRLLLEFQFVFKFGNKLDVACSDGKESASAFPYDVQSRPTDQQQH